MNAPIKDLQRRMTVKESGRVRYYEARDAGFTREGAARVARIALNYAATLDSQSLAEAGLTMPDLSRDDALVSALVAAGGYATLSERETRLGHVACLPLVPFGSFA